MSPITNQICYDFVRAIMQYKWWSNRMARCSINFYKTHPAPPKYEHRPQYTHYKEPKKNHRKNGQEQNDFGTRSKIKRNPKTEWHYKHELVVDQQLIDQALANYYAENPTEDWLR